MELGGVEGGDARNLGNARRRFVDEDSDAPRAGCDDSGCGFGRDVARASRVEVETDGGGTGGQRGGGVFGVGDAANLENHAAPNWARAAAGSPDFIRCSPTRKA